MDNKRISKIIKVIMIFIITVIVYKISGYASSRINEGGLWLVASLCGWFWCLFGFIGALLLVLNDD